MARGLSSKDAEAELQHLGQALFGGRANELKDVALYHHALDLMTTVHDNRNERLDSSDGSVPTALGSCCWPASNLVAQILMTASLAALVALTGFVAIVLDYPFTGDVQISRAPRTVSPGCRSKSRCPDGRALLILSPQRKAYSAALIFCR